jgi:hypothetical protein
MFGGVHILHHHTMVHHITILREGRYNGVVKELAGADGEEAIETALAPHIASFIDDIARPFLRAQLMQMKLVFEDSVSIVALAALELIVRPSILDILPKAFEKHRANAVFDLPLETPAEATAFAKAVKIAGETFEFSDQMKKRVVSEHATYRSKAGALQLHRLTTGQTLIKTITDIRLSVCPSACINCLFSLSPCICCYFCGLLL